MNRLYGEFNVLLNKLTLYQLIELYLYSDDVTSTRTSMSSCEESHMLTKEKEI